MISNGQFLLRHALNMIISIFSFGLIGNIYDLSLIPLITFFVVYFISNKGILFIQQYKNAKKYKLSRSQFIQIEHHLAEASKQANALTQKYVQVRSVKSFKVIYEMSKLAKRIISIVQKDPAKFYTIESFFYAHLPSALELSDKYALLVKEQVGGSDIHLALNDARNTLKDLYETMESDLKIALASDIESLKIELDFAKHANEERQNEITFGGDK